MNALIFDIETIPDTDFGRRLYDIEKLDDEAVGRIMFFKQRQARQTEFLPLVQLLKRVLYLYMLLLPYGKFLVLLVKVNFK